MPERTPDKLFVKQILKTSFITPNPVYPTKLTAFYGTCQRDMFLQKLLCVVFQRTDCSLWDSLLDTCLTKPRKQSCLRDIGCLIKLMSKAEMFPDLWKHCSQTSLAMLLTKPQSSRWHPIFNQPLLQALQLLKTGYCAQKDEIFCSSGNLYLFRKIPNKGA